MKKQTCDNCSHRAVCSYKEDFLTALEAVDNVKVSLGDHKDTDLKNITWIRPIVLECSFFLNMTHFQLNDKEV